MKISRQIIAGLGLAAAGIVQPASAATITQYYGIEFSGFQGFDASLGTLTSIKVTSKIFADGTFLLSPPPPPPPGLSWVDMQYYATAQVRFDLQFPVGPLQPWVTQQGNYLSDYGPLITEPVSRDYFLTDTFENTINLVSPDGNIYPDTTAYFARFSTPDYINVLLVNQYFNAAVGARNTQNSTVFYYGEPVVSNLTYAGTVVYEYTPFSGGVPEPSAWALMILGFGAAGSAMRSRRARTTSRVAYTA